MTHQPRRAGSTQLSHRGPMRIAVVCSADSWYLGDLQRAAGDRHTITSVSFRQLAAQVGLLGGTTSCGDLQLDEFDALLVRTMPPASLEQVVFRMDLLAPARRREWW